MPKAEPKSVAIPFALAKLLVAKPEDLNDASKHEQVHELAIATLRVLMEVS